ncbi:MAG: lysine 2,3-aminomutase [Gammaproteobacteria bacterium]
MSNLAQRDNQQPNNRNRYKVYTVKQWDQIPQIAKIPADIRLQMYAVANVLPFRVNQYVIDQLIDWDNVPTDPMFQLTFPQPGMLAPEELSKLTGLFRGDAPDHEVKATIADIRRNLNPHPAGQQQHNVPVLDGGKLEGMQHKYRDTLLFFPSQGQTCHAYCTFCFRWAQFIGDKELRFAAKETEKLHRYLGKHHEISDLLITGGDPMVMKTRHLEQYLTPLTQPQFNHVQTIRIGTKALTFWPQRFVTDPDADDLLRLMEKLVRAGKHVAIMAHYNHWRELHTHIARDAIERILNTGATIRSQGPLLANINDNAGDWAQLWKTQVKLGIIPYYMFVERDTGAKRYFEVSLAKAGQIYRDAIQQVSGLGRTARGPSMSTGPGKVEIQGVSQINNEKVFVLRFIQGRNPDWVQRPFFARYDENATWLNDLKPAFGDSKFFFEDEYTRLCTMNPWRDNIN